MPKGKRWQDVEPAESCTSEETAALETFREKVCQNEHVEQEAENLDWYDMSIGFFLAVGLSLDSAFKCGRIARYHYEYWKEG